MKRLRLAASFLTAAALNAAAQRISLEAPLSPRPGLTSAAASSPLARIFPLSLSPWAPGLPSAAVPPPPNAVALPAAAASAALPPPAALAPAALESAKPPLQTPAAKVIDGLREHGAQAGGLEGLQGEAGAGALEKNFMSAASLGDGLVAPPLGGAARLPSLRDMRPLMTRMLERVRLDDRGRPDEKKALAESFQRLLETPTGRRYAEEFLAEGLTAVVRFDNFPDSKLFLVEGRKKFYAAQAYTDWRPEGYADIRLNRHYVDGDSDYMRESLPSIIGHELLGHGLWYGRAAKEGLHLVFHCHELNETLARLIGWAVDYELDGRFEDTGAWSYLSDRAHYLANLKMSLPYYAITFGQEELARPLEALSSRLASAEREVESARRNLAAQKTWPRVLDHFERDHGVPARRFELLRKEFGDLEARYERQIVIAESIVKEVSGFRQRIETATDRAAELYLKQSAAHPFFKRLSDDAARLGAALETMTRERPPSPPRPALPRPVDQISWEELVRMYRNDQAEDARRPVKHWL